MLFSFHDISYSMGTDKVRHICASGTVKPNSTLVARGPSGSGKTTLLRILARLRRCRSGETFLNGHSWKEFSGVEWRRKVHYLSQRPALFEGTVAANMSAPFQLNIVSRDKQFCKDEAKTLLSRLLLPEDIWNQDAVILSGGETARIAFARALLVDPCVLLLDEPTAALDTEAAQALYSLLAQWLQKPNKACLLVSHNNDYEILNPSGYVDLVVQKEGM